MTPIEIVATTNGPYVVRGRVELRRKDGSLIATTEGETWLCRCGRSGTKPFCDDSHETCGFDDSATHVWTGQPGDDPGRPVITVRTNGPYFVEAQAIVRNETGEVLAEGTRMVLCRCGASTRKPFCDASHRRSGFVAE